MGDGDGVGALNSRMKTKRSETAKMFWIALGYFFRSCALTLWFYDCPDSLSFCWIRLRDFRSRIPSLIGSWAIIPSNLEWMFWSKERPWREISKSMCPRNAGSMRIRLHLVHINMTITRLFLQRRRLLFLVSINLIMVSFAVLNATFSQWEACWVLTDHVGKSYVKFWMVRVIWDLTSLFDRKAAHSPSFLL